MPLNYFYTGKVIMRANKMDNGVIVQPFIEEAWFNHGTKEGRMEVRDFVHKHLIQGNMITTLPVV